MTFVNIDSVKSLVGLPRFNLFGKFGPLPIRVYSNTTWFKVDYD